MRVELELTKQEIKQVTELLGHGVFRLVLGNSGYDPVERQSFLSTYHEICDQLREYDE